MKKQKIAIVHDWLYGGGAELVVEQLHKLYPEAPIYTSYCTPEWRERLDDKVITGYLQQWPFSKLRKFLPVLRQQWFKKLDLSEFDLVISSSGNGEAKFVLPRVAMDSTSSPQESKNDSSPSTSSTRPIHVCYCHTPTHFYWRKYEEYVKHPSFKPKWLVRLGLKLLVKPLRKHDYQAAQSVDYFIANSSHIQKDIKKHYGRESVVIHPPVDIEKWKVATRSTGSAQEGKTQKVKSEATPPTTHHLPPTNGPRFITWGRHVPYKRFDLAIAACNQLQLPLTIVGSGPETPRLKKLAGPTIRFEGFVNQPRLLELANQADAFIFPGEEDFGIAPVEAMATGLPVIAYKSGGALDYVVEGKTGTFFEKQVALSLLRAIYQFEPGQFEGSVISRHAQKFSTKNFTQSIQAFLRDRE